MKHMVPWNEDCAVWVLLLQRAWIIGEYAEGQRMDPGRNVFNLFTKTAFQSQREIPRLLSTTPIANTQKLPPQVHDLSDAFI